MNLSLLGVNFSIPRWLVIGVASLAILWAVTVAVDLLFMFGGHGSGSSGSVEILKH